LIEGRVHPAGTAVDTFLGWTVSAGLSPVGRHRERFAQGRCGSLVAPTCPAAIEPLPMARLTGPDRRVDSIFDPGSGQSGELLSLAQALFGAGPLDLLLLDSDTPLVAAVTDALGELGPFTVALAEVRAQTQTACTHAWRQFLWRYRNSFHARARAHAGCAEPDSLATFRRRRRIRSGFEPTFDLVEAVSSHEVAAVFFDSQVHRDVRAVADDVVSWTDDLYSVRKKSAGGDFDHLVAVVKGPDGGWDEAIVRTAADLELFVAADVRRHQGSARYRIPATPPLASALHETARPWP
jgi:hypothetical protein